MKYLPLFHHFKAIYQFPKHIIFLVKIVANASLIEVVTKAGLTFIPFDVDFFLFSRLKCFFPTFLSLFHYHPVSEDTGHVY